MYWQRDIVFLFKYVLLCAFSDHDLSGKVDQCKKFSKMICNMSVFEKANFSLFGACAIMKKDLEPSFLTWETRGIFCGGSRHPRKAICKVSALLYFFPTKNIIHLDYKCGFILKLLNNSPYCCSLINIDFLLSHTAHFWWKHYFSFFCLILGFYFLYFFYNSNNKILLFYK